MSTTTQVHASFALALQGVLVDGAAAGAVCSPWSVSSALAMLAPGANAAARAEIIAALVGNTSDVGVGDPLAALADDAGRIADQPVGTDHSVLSVVNTLWVEERYRPVPEFVAALQRWPGAALRQLGMADDPEGARAIINRDVASSTHQLIPEILPDGSISESDRAVLVNAVHLLAGWLERFAPEATIEESFLTPSAARPVPTMRGTRDAPYSNLHGWEYVALPLRLGMAAEVILPPGDGPGPLDVALLGRLRDAGADHRVDLHLPRFRVSSQWDLKDPLEALGVRAVFDPDSPALIGIAAGEELFVSGAFHQAVLRVDEQGVEAAAATAIVARAVTARLLPYIELRVDRPFWFLVTHQHTGIVVFLAWVSEP